MSDTVRARVLPDAFVPLLKEGKQLADSLLEQSLPFSLDEWGYNWGERGTPVSMTVDALLLTYLCAHADDWGIEKALYFHPINEGLILAEPKEARLDYTGRVFRLFAGHRGAQRLEALSLIHISPTPKVWKDLTPQGLWFYRDVYKRQRPC